MSQAKKSVLLCMALLGATNAPKAAYENVEGGEAAWTELMAEGLIVKDQFYVLSDKGREAIRAIMAEK